MSPNKDETGRGLSRILLLMVVWQTLLFISDGAKHPTLLMMAVMNTG